MRELTISGEVQGNIVVTAGTRLLIADGASVHGDVRVERGAEAVIEGEVQGDVSAHGSVQFEPSASVFGNVTTGDVVS